MKNLKILFTLFILSITYATNAQTLKSENDWIRQKIDSVVKANDIPALSVGIIRNGKLAYVEGFGHLNRKSKKEVNENTLYQIGSDTKKFTGIIARNLVKEGKLSLSEPIVNYLKDELSEESKEKLSGVTLKNLLQHKAGIPNIEPSNRRTDGDPMLIPFSEKDLIKDLNRINLEFEPNSDFGYSNFGYAIVGYLCEKVSGLDYSVLVKKYVVDLYKMPDTAVYPTKKQLKKVALPYRKDNRNVESKPWAMGKMTPAGGVYSNVKDISTLMLAQMEAYQHFNSTGEMNNPLILTENANTEEGHYGFGLGKSVDEDGIRYGHGGDLDGYASGYVFSPQDEIGVILLTSSGGRWIGQLEKSLRIGLMKRLRNSNSQ